MSEYIFQKVLEYLPMVYVYSQIGQLPSQVYRHGVITPRKGLPTVREYDPRYPLVGTAFRRLLQRSRNDRKGKIWLETFIPWSWYIIPTMYPGDGTLECEMRLWNIHPIVETYLRRSIALTYADCNGTRRLLVPMECKLELMEGLRLLSQEQCVNEPPEYREGVWKSERRYRKICSLYTPEHLLTTFTNL